MITGAEKETQQQRNNNQHNNLTTSQSNGAIILFIRLIFLAHNDLHTKINVVSDEADVSAYDSPRDAQAEEEISLQQLQHNDDVENSQQSSVGSGKFNITCRSHIDRWRAYVNCHRFLSRTHNRREVASNFSQ